MGKTRLHPTAFISRLKYGARALADPDCSASPIAQLGPKPRLPRFAQTTTKFANQGVI